MTTALGQHADLSKDLPGNLVQWLESSISDRESRKS